MKSWWMRRMSCCGKVTLVGAGCGKGLLTVRGWEAVQQADVVVYDALLDEDILWETKPDCERIFVGKRSGRHSSGQDEINRLLAEKARQGKNVVRLKGGDGFVFGRGGEELQYLQEKKISCEVIPGVSSAIAVPEHFGISVTHRDVAQSFSVVTGHEAGEERENYHALAQLKGTLVFLMGLSRLGEIAEELMANGKAADTSAAVLSHGYLPDERRFDGTLATIAEIAKDAETPAILLIGETARMNLAEKKTLPLSGATVAVTGTVSFTKRLETVLSALGAYVQRRPHLRIVSQAEQIPNDFAGYDWLVFTSANGVDVFFGCLRSKEVDLRKLAHLKFACIGDGTRQRLWDFGIAADVVPKVFTAKELGRSLSAQLAEREQLLILRAENGSHELTEELDRAGVRYEDRKIYRTEAVQLQAGMTERKADGNGKVITEENAARERENHFRQRADYLVFASAMGARAYFENGGIVDEAKIVCIGELTAEALREAGGWYDGGADRVKDEFAKRDGNNRLLIAREHTVEGIAEAILEDWRKMK